MTKTRADDAAFGRRRVTQADVARRAQVSGAIVSAVINGRQHGTIRISERTRERVWNAVRELGYVPNIAARNLARGRNRLLGIFTYQALFPLQSRNFYHEFLIGIEEEAEQAGYNLLLFTGAKDSAGNRSIYADGVNRLQLADGAVLVGPGEPTEEIARLAAEGYPFVVVGRRELPEAELSYVAADYATGVADLVTELVRRGHRRIAMVHSGRTHESLTDRRRGFQRARDRHGLSASEAPQLVWSADDAVQGEGTVRDVTALLDRVRRHDTTAVLVEDTSLAVRIRAAARRAGIRVPDQLAIAALGGAAEVPGGSRLADLVIPRRDMGREAVRLLLRLLADPACRPVRSTLPCAIRQGDTI